MSERHTVSRSPIGALVFTMSCVALAPLVAGWVGSDVLPPTWLSAALGAALVALHLATVGRWSLAIDPVIWVPIAMLLFYFGLVVPVEILNLPGATYNTWRVGWNPDPRVGFAAGLMTLSGLLAGIHWVGLIDCRRFPSPAPPDPRMLPAAFILAIVGISMMAVGVAIAGPGLLFGSYQDVWRAKFYYLDVRVLEVGFMVVQAAAHASFAASVTRRGSARLLGIALAGWIAVYALLTGDRAALFSCGLALGWVYSQRVVRISRAVVTAAAAIALLSVPVIKEYREWRSVRAATEVGVSALYGRAFGEMGSTVQVFSHTLALIPEHKPFSYGLGSLHAVASLVPNPFPTRGKSFLPDPLEHSPSVWLPRTINEGKFLEGGAYGFAIGAAWYFDFGVGGILVGMLLTGAFLAWSRNLAWRGSTALVFSALAYTAMILLVRNALGSPIKLMLWPFAALLGVRALIAVAGRSGAQRKNALR